MDPSIISWRWRQDGLYEQSKAEGSVTALYQVSTGHVVSKLGAGRSSLRVGSDVGARGSVLTSL